MTALVPALCGGLFMAGIIGLFLGMRRSRPAPGRSTATTVAAPRWLLALTKIPTHKLMIGTVSTAIGAAIGIMTGWIVAALAVPVLVLGLPRVFGARESAGRIERLDALADWSRTLAGVLNVASGLEGAILASVRSAPDAIRNEVTMLAARLRSSASTEAALRRFADDINMPTGDLVAATLILAARQRAGGVAPVLQGLSSSVAANVAAQREVEAERQKPHQTVRIVLMIAMVAVPLCLVAFRDVYGSPLGQLVLALYLLLGVAALTWMRKMSKAQAVSRFITGRPS